MKKVFSFLLIAVGLMIFTGNKAQAQASISEITIGNTVSAFFEGQQAVSHCSNPPAYFAKPFWFQNNNSGVAHFLNGIPGEHTYIITITDQFGDMVVLGAPGSGYPQWAMFPSGDQATLNYYGCSHPTVIEIF